MVANAAPDPHRPSPSSWEAFLGPWRIDLSYVQKGERLQFRLFELLAAVTVASILLAAFRVLGIFGALAAFVSAVVFTQWIYPRLNPKSPQRSAAMFDFVWGVVMPVVCLVFDPFVFKRSALPPWETGDLSMFANQLEPQAHVAYCFIAWQIGCLIVWFVAGGRMSPEWAILWSGVLRAGFALATFISLLLTLPALIGTFFYGIGAIGLTPLFTARAYYRRSLEASLLAGRDLSFGTAMLLILLGFVVGGLLPAGLAVVLRFAVGLPEI